MTEHEKETAFLRRIILFDDTDECRRVEKRIAEVQRNECCVQRAMLLMTLFAALSTVGLGYETIFQENFLDGAPRFFMTFVRGLGLASIICLLVFSGLLIAYRRQLNCLREECRRLVIELLELQPRSAHPTALAANHFGTGIRAVVQPAVNVAGASETPRLRSAPDATQKALRVLQ